MSLLEHKERGRGWEEGTGKLVRDMLGAVDQVQVLKALYDMRRQ